MGAACSDEKKRRAGIENEEVATSTTHHVVHGIRMKFHGNKVDAAEEKVMCPSPDIEYAFHAQGAENLTDRSAHHGMCGDRSSAGGCFHLAPSRANCDIFSDPVHIKRRESVAPVTLHVYYVGNSDAIENISEVAQDFLGQGGIFHGAVEIYGREWSYGGGDEGSGVFQMPPRSCPMHRYRESVYMGDCSLTEAQVFQILQRMIPQWQAPDYDLLRKNCCSFSRAFCQELGVGEIPYWVYELAETGAMVADAEITTINAFWYLESGIAAEIAQGEALIGLADESSSQ